VRKYVVFVALEANQITTPDMVNLLFQSYMQEMTEKGWISEHRIVVRDVHDDESLRSVMTTLPKAEKA
jgi:hypothetical protein